jgi:hypothetical protein
MNPILARSGLAIRYWGLPDLVLLGGHTITFVHNGRNESRALRVMYLRSDYGGKLRGGKRVFNTSGSNTSEVRPGNY